MRPSGVVLTMPDITHFLTVLCARPNTLAAWFIVYSFIGLLESKPHSARLSQINYLIIARASSVFTLMVIDMVLFFIEFEF